MSKIKVHYNVETGEVLGYYHYSVKYSNIPETIIEITEEEHQASLGKTMIISNGKLKEYTIPAQMLLKQQRQEKIQTLECKYQQSKENIKIVYKGKEIDRISGFKDILNLCIEWKDAESKTIPSIGLPIVDIKKLYTKILLLRDEIAANLEKEKDTISAIKTKQGIDEYIPTSVVTFDAKLVIDKVISQ